MTIKEKWIDHLKENNMTYIQHMRFAVFYGCICFVAGFCLILHSILPCFFQNTGSDLVRIMASVFKKRIVKDDT